MIRYRLALQPDVRFHIAAAPLTKEALEQLITGAVVHGIEDGGFGYPATVDLQLDQKPDDQVLNSLVMVAQRCGYQVIEGEVTQWVDAEAQGALLGLFGGAGGGALARNGGAALLFAAVGAILGQIAGAKVRKHEVLYRISRAYPGGPVELRPVNGAKAPTITLADWLGPVRP